MGDKEIENGEVSVRSRKDGDIGTMSVNDFITMIQGRIESRIID